MLQEQKNGLIKKQTVTPVEIAAIQNLAEQCNRYEQLHMRLIWRMLRSRPGAQVNDFLYYEDATLVGYLAVDNFGVEERELLCMVHPDYRRRGIASTLLATAMETCKSYGAQRFLLICEQSSPSGQAFVNTLDLNHAEHKMVLTRFQERGLTDDRLTTREAYVEDIDMIATILASSFDETEEEARQGLLTIMQDPDCRHFLATFGEAELGCKEPVGYLRIYEDEDEIGIYGFGISPAYRRRGYGRQMLEEAIRFIRSYSQKTIILEVEIENTNAVALYHSCGFQIKTTYNYYLLKTS